jgi:hypothetical protein
MKQNKNNILSELILKFGVEITSKQYAKLLNISVNTLNNLRKTNSKKIVREITKTNGKKGIKFSINDIVKHHFSDQMESKNV